MGDQLFICLNGGLRADPQTQTRSQRRRRSERQGCTYRKQGGRRGQHCREAPIVSLTIPPPHDRIHRHGDRKERAGSVCEKTRTVRKRTSEGITLGAWLEQGGGAHGTSRTQGGGQETRKEVTTKGERSVWCRGLASLVTTLHP